MFSFFYKSVNINNLRYADDTTLMAESKELKSLSVKLCTEHGDTESDSLCAALSCRSNNSLKIHTMLFLTRDTVLIAIPLGSI